MASRPAQGNNSIAPLKRPGPAYRPDAAPKISGRGSLSKPAKPPRASYGSPGSDVPNATPKIVTL
jgi:hypothetical protein